MARNVKVASVALQAPYHTYSMKPEGMSIFEFVTRWVDANLDKVFVDKPDLIVLPEVIDSPMGTPRDKLMEYYEERGDRFVEHIQKRARENNCYIAFGTRRFLPDKTARNSCYMIGRKGEIVGIYDKNYIVPSETSDYNIICGREPVIFDCDFGRVGAVVCFDMNFEELRAQYKKLKPDIMIFPTNYDSGYMKNFFAQDVKCHLISSCAYEIYGGIISPLGFSIGEVTNVLSYCIMDINLDCAVVTTDFNVPKINAAREKYGELLKVDSANHMTKLLLSYRGTDKNINDILKEFEIGTMEEYLDYSREHREKNLAPEIFC